MLALFLLDNRPGRKSQCVLLCLNTKAHYIHSWVFLPTHIFWATVANLTLLFFTVIEKEEILWTIYNNFTHSYLDNVDCSRACQSYNASTFQVPVWWFKHPDTGLFRCRLLPGFTETLCLKKKIYKADISSVIYCGSCSYSFLAHFW